MVLIILLRNGYNMYIVQIEERCNLLAYRGVHTKEGKRIMLVIIFLPSLVCTPLYASKLHLSSICTIYIL